MLTGVLVALVGFTCNQFPPDVVVGEIVSPDRGAPDDVMFRSSS
jgi:hypothetical protein